MNDQKQTQKQPDTGEEAPPEAECDQGIYLLAVTYEHKVCGARVAMAEKESVLAALSNAGLRVKCNACGKWLFLKPGQQMQMEPMPAGRPGLARAPQPNNRQARRAAARERRTKGGLILPN